MDKTRGSLAPPKVCEPTSDLSRVETPACDPPCQLNGMRRVQSELRDQIDVWVNEGGAGGEVNG